MKKNKLFMLLCLSFLSLYAGDSGQSGSRKKARVMSPEEELELALDIKDMNLAINALHEITVMDRFTPQLVDDINNYIAKSPTPVDFKPIQSEVEFLVKVLTSPDNQIK